MPTVLDSLVLEFNLDASNFTQGQRDVMQQMRKLQEEAEKNATGVEASTKKIFDFMTTLKREALTVLGVFLGGRGIGEFVDHVTKLDAATGRLSTTMGMSVNQLGQWQGAVRQVGGSVESANAALRAMDAELVRFDQTGQSSILGVISALGLSTYGQGGKLKTSDQMMLDIAAALEARGMEPRQQAGFLRMLGVNDDMINLLVRGTKEIRSFLDAAKEAGTTTDLSARQAQEYQRQLQLLDQTTTNLGRNLLNFFLPAITAVTKGMADLFKGWNRTPEQTDVASATNREDLIRRFGHPRDFVNALGKMFGMGPGVGDRIYADDDPKMDTARAKLKAGLLEKRNAPPPSGGGALTSDAEEEAFIRQVATSRGIDPNIAVAVWSSEGRGAWKSRIPGEESYGPFQLHYGGGSKGDEFTARTGLDARDRSTEKAQIEFAMDEAKKGGWGPWHGWKGDPWAGINRGSGQGVTVNVGGVTVNDQSGNADSIANNIGGALKRSVNAGLANTGAQ